MSNQDLVKKFNKLFPVGAPVFWRSVAHSSIKHKPMLVRHPAVISESGNAVAWFIDKAGACSIEPDFVDYERTEFIKTEVAPLSIEDFSDAAGRTLLEKPDFQISDDEVMFAWNALGLAGEAGEVAELVKKSVFHRQPLDKEKLKKELGDVLWYLNAICRKSGFTLTDVMAANVAKLNARYPNGYNAQDSINRQGNAA